MLYCLQDFRRVLYGGCGFTPDIPSLQAWLACAWALGFDTEGAEQLGYKIQGTRKWVGTTEAAAVLRQFGIRAHVVDFKGVLLDFLWLSNSGMYTCRSYTLD